MLMLSGLGEADRCADDPSDPVCQETAYLRTPDQNPGEIEMTPLYVGQSTTTPAATTSAQSLISWLENGGNSGGAASVAATPGAVVQNTGIAASLSNVPWTAWLILAGLGLGGFLLYKHHAES